MLPVALLAVVLATVPASQAPRATLVESCPTGMDDINRTVALHTHTALERLLDGANATLDIAVMYWSLLPESCGAGTPYNVTKGMANADCAGFSNATLDDQLLAARGRRVWAALERAAARGVAVRVLQSAGFASEVQHGTPNAESAALAQRFPRAVMVRTLNMSAWYGDGIQHAKYLVADGADLLLGSSNFFDWRSLSQVKELGLLLEHAPAVAADVQATFNDAWAVAGLRGPAPPHGVEPLDDPQALRRRPVPCWSPLLPASRRCASPLPPSNPTTLEAPLRVALPGGAASVFVSCSPPAFCGGGGGGGGSCGRPSSHVQPCVTDSPA